MEETNQSTHPLSCPSSPPTHLINEIKPYAGLLLETCRSLHNGYICCLLICSRGTVTPDCSQLLPRQNLVLHVVARKSTGAWQRNRNESAAHGLLFNSASSVFNCEQWSDYLNVGLIGSVKFSPKTNKKKFWYLFFFQIKLKRQYNKYYTIIVSFILYTIIV